MDFGLYYYTFNTLEALFWISIGLVLCVTVKKITESLRETASRASMVFVIFGISDFLEMYIGGFLEPHQWWLFALKIVCVIGLVVLLIQYLHIRLKE